MKSSSAVRTAENCDVEVFFLLFHLSHSFVCVIERGRTKDISQLKYS